MNHLPRTTHNNGFTLIEMSIVLVIIGIILASVMKGRDLIYSAKETKAEQTFFLKWQTILNEYYKATGYALGDGKMNGGDENATVDSFADYLLFDDEDKRTHIKMALRAAGIDPCKLITSNVYGDASEPKCANGMNVFAYNVDSENVGHREVTIGLGALAFSHRDKEDKEIKTTKRSNVLVFYDLPLDYAKRVDTTIDGTALGEEGKALFLCFVTFEPQYYLGVKAPYTHSLMKKYYSQYFLQNKPGYTIIRARPWPSPEAINDNQTLDPKPLERYFNMGVLLDY